MLVLYAVVPGRVDAGLTASAEAVGLDIVQGGEVAVLYERVTGRLDTSKQAVLDLGGRLTRIAQVTDLLPMRYGSVVADETELEALLARRAGEWAQRLSQVAGHDELIVHASDSSTGPGLHAAPEPSRSGRAYLEHRAAEHRAVTDLEQAITAVVASYCRDLRTLRGQGEIRLACLVTRSNQAPLREAVDDWATSADGRAATVTGPYPAFSFAEEADT